MKIALSAIQPNPYRDLDRNPVNQEQVAKLAESIGRTGFWDNVVVRKVGSKYQLAHGHNRLEALRQSGATHAEFIVKRLSDYDMLTSMIDENATQQSITPAIVMENVTAAILLAEKMLTESANVTEFNAAMGSSGVSEHHSKWTAQQFSQVKNSINQTGEIGRRALAHFYPGKTPEVHVLQAAIDSHYAEARAAKAAREEKEAKAEARAAVKAGDTNAREAAEAKAFKAKEKKARAESAISRDLLEKLPGQAHVALVTQVVKENGIPKKDHAALVDAVIDGGWVARMGDRSRGTGSKAGAILGEGAHWWYARSGKKAKDDKARAFEVQRRKAWEKRNKSDINEWVQVKMADMRKLEKEVGALRDNTQHINPQQLRDKFYTQLLQTAELLQTVAEELVATHEKVISDEEVRLLAV
jgi:hypothetical protein